MGLLDNKRILVTGGTGSLGQSLINRLLSGEMGQPKKIIVFSRDEAKQHYMRVAYLNQRAATDEVIYHNFEQFLEFWIGDIRDFHSASAVLRNADVVFHTAAIKQVPTCEYFPFEGVLTNIIGTENIVRAIQEHHLDIETVVGISTDKACKPVNVMGMTKSVQERILIHGNLRCPGTRFVCVRFGNVLASRGSVIPLFHSQIKSGGPVTITTSEMTRFLMSLDDAVDLIFHALREAHPGETYIPQVPTAKVTDIARVLIGDRPIETVVTGIRPGEKIHEVLVSEEELHRSVARGQHYVVLPILPELRRAAETGPFLKEEYSSASGLMNLPELEELLRHNRLLVEDDPSLLEH